jgi:hypothetical protein
MIINPSSNISKNCSKKVDVFGAKFGTNSSILFDLFLLLFGDGGNVF